MNRRGFCKAAVAIPSLIAWKTHASLMMVSGNRAEAGAGGGGGSSSYTATHYVTVNAAGGGDGSISDPWTLTEAMSNAVAGNKVQVGPGLYEGTPNLSNNNRWNPFFSPSNSGTEGNEIVFFAQTPAATNLGSSGSWSELTVNVFETYLPLTEPTNSPQPCYGVVGYASRHDVVWDGFYTSAANGAAPYHGQCSVGAAQRIHIRRGVFDRITTNGGDQFCAINSQDTDGLIVSDCVFRGGFSHGDGSHNDAAITTYNVDDLLIEHCTFMRNDAADKELSAGIFLKGQNADGNSGIVRYNYFDGQVVSGLEVNEADVDKGGVAIYQNFFDECKFKIDVSTDLSKNIEFYNNTLIGISDSGQNCFFSPNSAHLDEATIRDNIFVMVAGQTYGSYFNVASPNDYALIDFNCYYRAGGSYQFYNGSTRSGLTAWQVATTGVDDNSIEADPEFTNAGAGDYTLGVSSPCRNASSTGSHMGAYITGAEEIGVRASPTY